MQFERTLIVAEDDAYVSYLEGCTAPSYDKNQARLSAALVYLCVWVTAALAHLRPAHLPSGSSIRGSSSTRRLWTSSCLWNCASSCRPWLLCQLTVHWCAQLHAAVVELSAGARAEIKYSTVQNWYAGNEEGVGGIFNFVTKRGLCAGANSHISWTQVGFRRPLSKAGRLVRLVDPGGVLTLQALAPLLQGVQGVGCPVWAHPSCRPLSAPARLARLLDPGGVPDPAGPCPQLPGSQQVVPALAAAMLHLVDSGAPLPPLQALASRAGGGQAMGGVPPSCWRTPWRV